MTDQKLTLWIIVKVVVFLMFFPISLFFVWPRQMCALAGALLLAFAIGVFLITPWGADTVEVTRPMPAKLRGVDSYTDPAKTRHAFGDVPNIKIPENWGRQ